MKKIILSAIAGAATGYFIRKIQDKTRDMKLTDNISESNSKAKTKLKAV